MFVTNILLLLLLLLCATGLLNNIEEVSTPIATTFLMAACRDERALRVMGSLVL